MRAFLVSLVLLVAITAAAYFVLEGIDMSAQTIFSQSGSVRLR